MRKAYNSAGGRDAFHMRMQLILICQCFQTPGSLLLLRHQMTQIMQSYWRVPLKKVLCPICSPPCCTVGANKRQCVFWIVTLTVCVIRFTYQTSLEERNSAVRIGTVVFQCDLLCSIQLSIHPFVSYIWLFLARRSGLLRLGGVWGLGALVYLQESAGERWHAPQEPQGLISSNYLLSTIKVKQVKLVALQLFYFWSITMQLTTS